jgi:hypothetical protein
MEQLEGLHGRERGSFLGVVWVEREGEIVGTATIKINSEVHYTCFGSECLCIYV